MSIPHLQKIPTMRRRDFVSGSNRDSFGIADEVAQLIDAYLLYRRAVVSANTAATDERLLRYLREYLTTPDAQRHTQLRPLFSSVADCVARRSAAPPFLPLILLPRASPFVHRATAGRKD